MIGEHVPLTLGALRPAVFRRIFSPSPPSVSFSRHVPGEIPVGVLAGIGGGVEAFPVSQAVCSAATWYSRKQFLRASPVFVAACAARGPVLRQRRVDLDFFSVVEEGEQAVEVLLRDGIELVIVALCAAHRQAQPDGADRGGAINDVASKRNCALSTPPSRLVRVLRWKPVATRCPRWRPAAGRRQSARS